MAAIDGITLDGHGTGRRYGSAVGLHLTEQSPISLIERLDGWVMEVRQGSGFVVARNEVVLGRADVLRQGFEQAERFLDVMSFELCATLAVGAPGRSHILLYGHEAGSVLERLTTSDLPISMKVELSVTGPDGKPVPPPPPPAAKWIPALRFYRLSQVSRSPHEAYRNLWLGLETLLSVAIPLRPKEKEGVWLRRAFRDLAGRIDLSRELPENTDPADYLMDRHYVGMRCNLFHAKVGAVHMASQLPSPEKALDAYAQLVRVWRTIATHVCQFRFAGNGVITYAGYAAHMAALFSDVRFTATDDPAEPQATDMVVSPSAHEVVTFDSSTHIGVDSPGRVENRGVIDVTSRAGPLPSFRRIGTSCGDVLYSLDYLYRGLDVNGIDRFEYRQMWRLQNAGTPREHFD